jgi:ankyrin repeat protein
MAMSRPYGQSLTLSLPLPPYNFLNAASVKGQGPLTALPTNEDSTMARSKFTDTPEQMGKELLDELDKDPAKCDHQKAIDLINRGAKLDEKDNVGFTPLIFAAIKGYTDIATALINKDAKLDEKDNVGFTALIWAANLGHTDIATALINKGAKLDEKDDCGFTARDKAANHGFTDIVKAIEQAEKTSQRAIPATPQPSRKGFPAP